MKHYCNVNHIILCSWLAVLKVSTAATLCSNHQRCYQPRLNKGTMLGLHTLHFTTSQTGYVINIFASIKNWPWLRPRNWSDWTSGVGQKIRLQLHPKTSDSLRLRLRQPGLFRCGKCGHISKVCRGKATKGMLKLHSVACLFLSDTPNTYLVSAVAGFPGCLKFAVIQAKINVAYGF